MSYFFVSSFQSILPLISKSLSEAQNIDKLPNIDCKYNVYKDKKNKICVGKGDSFRIMRIIQELLIEMENCPEWKTNLNS